MSGALTSLATLTTLGMPVVNALGPDIMPAWIRQQRSIGKIIPDVTIEEQHNDRVQVTQHPVATGKPISDHMYTMPASLTMRVGWTNANPIGAFAGAGGFSSLFTSGDLSSVGGGITGSGGLLSTLKESRAKDIYDQLRDLMDTTKTPLPIKIVTGKRTYENMVLVELNIRTDHTTEYALMVDAHFQEVLLARIETTTQPALSAQPEPDKTATPDNTSQKQPRAPSELRRAKESGVGLGNILGIYW
jgi:hypothetical protein